MSDTTVLPLSKICTNPQCEHPGELQPVSAFYVRSGIQTPTIPGHYISECKACMKRRNAKQAHLPDTEPRTFTETVAIDYLREHGIHSLPGKAVSATDVDVVAWGAVWIEVKYARLEWAGAQEVFHFVTTPKQNQRGFLAHLVLLICEYPDGKRRFHLFDAHDPVFYMQGRLKRGFTFRPGATDAKKWTDGRVVMLQSMMDEAQDRLSLIPQAMQKISGELRGACGRNKTRSHSPEQ